MSDTIKKRVGLGTAYGFARAGGYEGTVAEFTELLGSIAIDLARIENLSVTVTTLPAGSQATASLNGSVLSLGIPKGDKGDKGNTGNTPDFGIGTVTTLSAGSSATASITGTAENPVLNLGIPEGQAGSGAVGTVASAYSASKTYAVGDYVIHNSNLYRCTTAITTAESFTAAHWTQVVLADDVSDLRSDLQESESSITSKMTKVASNNYAKSNEATMGYVAQNGTVYSSSSLWYTDKIPVEEGDEVRIYTKQRGAFEGESMRFVCAYNSDKQAVSASGTENVRTYTVPSGIAFVVLSVPGTSATVSELMITRNYEPTAYEPYFDPYYVASDDFIEDAMSDYEIPQEPVKGYNLLKTAQTVGTGYYYGDSVGTKIRFGTSTSYKYAVMPVKKNTTYTLNYRARFWAFTDDNDIVTSFGETAERVLNSGEGTKLYYSVDVNAWNWETSYGSAYAIAIAEGYHSTYQGMEKPSFISNLSQNMMDARYGCALPKKAPRFTVGIEQTWYYDNILALKSNAVAFGVYTGGTFVDGGRKFLFASASEGSNSYYYRVFDEHLACIEQLIQTGYKICADNVQNCSALVIGDSTVAQDKMTQTMLDAFTERGKTLTLLGTRGTAPNLHEGRAGWTAKGYCTVAESSGVVNPFYNNGFDFSYYMTNQGYSAPDFVVIQLGINDLYNVFFEESQSKIEETADYLMSMLDSIWSYNANQKILLNLPTALNNDQTKQYTWLFAVRNVFVRYNELIMYRTLDMSESNLRITNCHLILNPDTDIRDDVHPTDAGYAKMGMEVVSQINCWQNNY